MQLQTPAGTPDWTAGSDERLALSFVAATVVVAAVLSLLQWPTAVLDPLAEIAVRIVRPEMPEAVVEQPPAPAVPVAEPRSTVAVQPVEQSIVEETPPAAAAERAPGWDAVASAAIDDYLDASEKPPSMTAGLDERLRQHKLRYPPGQYEPPKPIWENAEPDQLGRTLLWHGDCYRVIADPNVTSQDKFRIFDQFIVHCLSPHEVPQELPWVDEIRRRYDYLGGGGDE